MKLLVYTAHVHLWQCIFWYELTQILLFLHTNRFYDVDDDTQNNPQPPQTYQEYTTLPPYYNYYQYSSEDPYKNQYSVPPTQPPIVYSSSPYKQFSISTTRSPYNFENFGQQFTTQPVAQPQTTKNPYIGNYYQIIQQTTKNPYDFANFGQPPKSYYNENVNNNYLKRSYNTASYYSDSSNVRNVTADASRRNESGG